MINFIYKLYEFSDVEILSKQKIVEILNTFTTKKVIFYDALFKTVPKKPS